MYSLIRWVELDNQIRLLLPIFAEETAPLTVQF